MCVSSFSAQIEIKLEEITKLTGILKLQEKVCKFYVVLVAMHFFFKRKRYFKGIIFLHILKLIQMLFCDACFSASALQLMIWIQSKKLEVVLVDRCAR